MLANKISLLKKVFMCEEAINVCSLSPHLESPYIVGELNAILRFLGEDISYGVRCIRNTYLALLMKFDQDLKGIYVQLVGSDDFVFIGMDKIIDEYLADDFVFQNFVKVFNEYRPDEN